MQLWQKYLKRLSTIVPIGTVGAFVLLGSTLPSNAGEGQPSTQYAAPDIGVSERLAAIRQAAFMAMEHESVTKRTDPNIQLAWGNRWNNFGWRGGRGRGRRGWNNFRPRWNNWGNSWRNW